MKTSVPLYKETTDKENIICKHFQLCVCMCLCMGICVSVHIYTFIIYLGEKYFPVFLKKIDFITNLMFNHFQFFAYRILCQFWNHYTSKTMI